VNLGTTIGYRYRREQFGAWQDRLGGLHVPGVALDGELFGKGWRLRTRARGHFDLMGVNTLSNTQWNEAYQNIDDYVIGKSILLNSGYYYGWGGSVFLQSELEVSRFLLGGSVFAASYESIEGFDRAREKLEDEIEGEDIFVDAEAWARARIHGSIFAELRFGTHHREGQLAEFVAEESMQRWTLEVGGMF